MIYTEDYESIFVVNITRIQAPLLVAYRKMHLIENEGIFGCSRLEYSIITLIELTVTQIISLLIQVD